MIKTICITIPKLKISQYQSQYLQKSRIFIRWNTDLEFAIYKFDNEFNYQEYRISLQHLGIQIDRIQFIDSNEGQFLMGSGKHENLFTIFVLGLQKQELVFVKIIKMDDVFKFGSVNTPNQFQIYKLKGDFNVVDFSQFPHVEEYTFATLIESFDILYFQQCQLLKLQRNSSDEYYLLPLSKLSQPVNYNQNMRNSIILKDGIKQSFWDDTWNEVVTKIPQIYYLYNKKRTRGHYFTSNDFSVPVFSEQFGVLHDQRYWLKIFLIRPKSKIIRKAANIRYLEGLEASYILCSRENSNDIIYDCTTGQHSQMEVPGISDLFNLQIRLSFLIHMDLPNHKLVFATEER